MIHEKPYRAPINWPKVFIWLGLAALTGFIIGAIGGVRW